MKLTRATCLRVFDLPSDMWVEDVTKDVSVVHAHKALAQWTRHFVKQLHGEVPKITKDKRIVHSAFVIDFTGVTPNLMQGGWKTFRPTITWRI